MKKKDFYLTLLLLLSGAAQAQDKLPATVQVVRYKNEKGAEYLYLAREEGKNVFFYESATFKRKRLQLAAQQGKKYTFTFPGSSTPYVFQASEQTIRSEILEMSYPASMRRINPDGSGSSFVLSDYVPDNTEPAQPNKTEPTNTANSMDQKWSGKLNGKIALKLVLTRIEVGLVEGYTQIGGQAAKYEYSGEITPQGQDYKMTLREKKGQGVFELNHSAEGIAGNLKGSWRNGKSSMSVFLEPDDME